MWPCEGHTIIPKGKETKTKNPTLSPCKIASQKLNDKSFLFYKLFKCFMMIISLNEIKILPDHSIFRSLLVYSNWKPESQKRYLALKSKQQKYSKALQTKNHLFFELVSQRSENQLTVFEISSWYQKESITDFMFLLCSLILLVFKVHSESFSSISFDNTSVTYNLGFSFFERLKMIRIRKPRMVSCKMHRPGSEADEVLVLILKILAEDYQPVVQSWASHLSSLDLFSNLLNS